ncbi:MAG: PEGA domain-containing protein, partial [Deltaproteobacteria bacterium]
SETYESEAPAYEGKLPPGEAPPPPPPEPSPETIAKAPPGEHFEFPKHPRITGTAVRWLPKGRSRANLRYSQPVYIYSDPPGADIYFNGEKAREKTPCAFLLPVPGTYTISLAKERYIPPKPKRITIQNSRQKIPPISMRLREIPQEE